jgi:osmoprotectant transport system ATP-binding protein
VGKWQGRPEVELVARMAELAEMAHLPIELLGKRPGELSGGQRQRVALMRALFLDPDVLLLDEPLGALDPMIRADLQRDLRAVFRDVGKTVVLVTHDMGEAAFFADEIVLLRAGRVVQWGAFRELVEAPVEPWVRDFIEAQRSPLDADA